MNQEFFVLELAHAADGHVKRIRISYKAIGYVLLSLFALIALALVGCSSYLRMTWKVANYDALRADFNHLRRRYQELQRVSHQHTEQLASLETLASEVSVAYGLNQEMKNEGLDVDNDALTPNVKESIEEYNFLRSASYGGIYRQYAHQWQTHARPSLWPVEGTIRSAFGVRSDPFSGEGAFHTGIDLAAPRGTPVQSTADGVIATVGWSGGYGRLLVVDHGNGVETYYAHLSRFLVLPGQEVSRGQVIALSGGTGHSTGPHLHYEVRLHGTPVNPYSFLPRIQVSRTATVARSDLGL
ncbi:MAG TPA: M23 family metallopeptidase [Bryobacteraceae bacterium]|jgi:murein DD-endopeptidase MepM/ murein hydrolase activator NlpD|nr:M23 family metallopeptidase [Bryobacteraceae bacterium]